MAHDARVHTRRRGRQQRTRPSLQLDPDRLRREAAAAMRRMFADRLPRATSRSSISRARNADASNPLYRLATWFRDAEADGFGREVADEAIAHLLTMRETIWGDRTIAWPQASVAEQIVDGEEDVLQMRAMHDGAALSAWIERKEAAIARGLAAVAAARRCVHGRRRAA